MVSQSSRQRCRFGLRKVAQFDSPADVERRHSRVTDQIGRGSYAQQAEGESLELRLLRAAVVASADGGEELIRGERQGADDIDFVDEHHKAVFRVPGSGFRVPSWETPGPEL